MDKTAIYQIRSNKASKRVDPVKQEYPKLFCVEFNCLFQGGREGLENAMINGLDRLGDRYNNVDYFTISDGYIQALDAHSKPYPIEVDHIHQKPLKKMRDSLYDPNGFKELINYCLQSNYKVIIYASTEYPAFISIVLAHGIGCTKEQLDNIYIIFNDYNAINKQNNFMCAEHIRHAERLTLINPLSHNKPVYGLVASSYNPDAKLIERADCDYAFIRIGPIYPSSNATSTSLKRFSTWFTKLLRRSFKLKNRCGDSSFVGSYWNRIKQFEKERGKLMKEVENNVNQSLLRSSVRKSKASTESDHKDSNANQLFGQSCPLSCRSSVRTNKVVDLKQPSGSSVRRWQSLTTRLTTNARSKQLCVLSNAESLAGQKSGNQSFLNMHVENWMSAALQIREEKIDRKLRTKCHGTLWKLFNGPQFCISFSW